MTTCETSAPEILAHVKISEVWAALGGGELRHGRGRAWWRDGDGYNVSLNDARGVWFDHRDGAGGGVLGLVVHVRGDSRADALRWCAGLAGIPLSDEPLSAEDRARWAREQREIARHLPAAQLWRRAALVLGEEVLDSLKTALFDPTLPRPEIDELRDWTARLARWRKLDGAALVAEYRVWLMHHPQLTTGMVQAARRLEGAEQRAILRYMEATAAEAKAA